jgi:hypothetical protein
MMNMNPITRILRSNAPRGLKLIALSLVVLLLSALPIMIYVAIGPADGNPVGLGLLFFAGAMVAHVGFVVGLVMLIYDAYFRKR